LYLVLPLAAVAWSQQPATDAALRQLTEGNRRYADVHLKHPHQDQQRRVELSTAQHPFAAILSCSDSRVPPEVVFDEGLGDLFVVRVAGNIVDDAVLGSLEYAAEHLHTPLIVVLGHTSCGAVAATADGGEVHDHVRSLVEAIKPAVEAARKLPGDLKQNSVRTNVLQSLKLLRESKPTLVRLEHKGELRIIGAIYGLKTGTVEWLKD